MTYIYLVLDIFKYFLCYQTNAGKFFGSYSNEEEESG